MLEKISHYPELMKHWDYEKNTVSPEEITKGYGQKCFWVCEQGHSWEARPRSKGGCPTCLNLRFIPGYNDLQTRRPEIAKEWDYTKNSDTPSEIPVYSKKRVSWVCSTCGQSWDIEVYSRTRTDKNYGNCPYCTGRLPTPGVNDLKTLFPEVAKEFCYEKNGDIRPENLLRSSHKKVWWCCSKCGFIWLTRVDRRTNLGTGCPKCKQSHGEKKVEMVLTKLNIPFKKEYSFEDCKHVNALRFDFVVLDEQGKVLGCIEYDGKQHFWPVDFSQRKRDKERVEEDYDMNLQRDGKKNKYCQENKIPLLRIPYDSSKPELMVERFIKIITKSISA